MCPAKALDNNDSFVKKECSDLSLKMVNHKLLIECFLCRKVCPYGFGEKQENKGEN